MTSLLRYFRLSSRSVRAYAVYLENADPDFSPNEMETGAFWVDGRPVFRKTVDTGALPDSTSKLVAHGIGVAHTVVGISGISFNGTASLAVPNGGANSVNVTTDQTNINVLTTTDLSSLTSSYVTLEYVKT